MQQLLTCLLTLLLAACSSGVALDAPDPLDPPQQPATTFSSVDDPRGLAWAWDADPSLRVTLLDHPDQPPGLAIEHDGRSLSVPVDYGLGPMDLPVLIAGPRADGTQPLAADDRPGLHLLLAGSEEHGCPSDDLEVDLLPTWADDGLQLDVAISGVPYLALPADGRVLAADADGRHAWTGAELAVDGGSVELDDFVGLVMVDGSLGTVRLAADAPVAWAQLQGHGDFIEVDFDHSCEANPPQTVAELRLTVWL